MVDKMSALLVENRLLTKRNRMENGAYTSNLYTVLVVGGSRQERLGSPMVSARVADENGTNSIHITQSIEVGASEDGQHTQEVRKVVFVSEDSDERSDPKSPRISGDKRKAYDELVAWAENERGFKFLTTHRTKQYKAFKIANENGITREQLQEKWEDMAGEKFWQKNGYDWMNVIEEFNKKPL